MNRSQRVVVRPSGPRLAGLVALPTLLVAGPIWAAAAHRPGTAAWAGAAAATLLLVLSAGVAAWLIGRALAVEITPDGIRWTRFEAAGVQEIRTWKQTEFVVDVFAFVWVAGELPAALLRGHYLPGPLLLDAAGVERFRAAVTQWAPPGHPLRGLLK